jgi:hypothetical protein
VVQEGDRRCKKSTLNDLAYLTPLRIPLMNPAIVVWKVWSITNISFLAILHRHLLNAAQVEVKDDIRKPALLKKGNRSRDEYQENWTKMDRSTVYGIPK